MDRINSRSSSRVFRRNNGLTVQHADANIVPLQRIDALLSEPGGRYGIRVDNGAHVPVGRGRYAALNERWTVR